MTKSWSVELWTLRNVLRHGRTVVQKHQGKKNLLQKGHFSLLIPNKIRIIKMSHI